MKSISRKEKTLRTLTSRGQIHVAKKKPEEAISAKTTKETKYTAKAKRVYQAKKKEEKVEKGVAKPREKIMHSVWADRHTGIDQRGVR